MGIQLEQISIVMVLIEGVVSFFSPCVVPLLPLYMGYLSSNAKTTLSDGRIIYNRRIVLIQTICFVGGISLSFVILGLAFTSLGQFIESYQAVFQIIAGILILVLGLYQLGFLNLSFLNQEKRLSIQLPLERMNPILAFVLGFLFSFTWTPCVGPALTSILLLTSTSSVGYLYVLVYAIGFVIPFLILGLFTSQVLNFLKDRKRVLPMIVKIGAVLLLVIGSYSLYQGIQNWNHQKPVDEPIEQETFPNIVLSNMEGKKYQLSDYKGKVIFLNFWATWCGYCQQELVHLEELYQMQDPEVQLITVLVVTNETEQEIKDFLGNKEMSFPVLIDWEGEYAMQYGVNSFPRSFLITKDYEMLGYIPGYVDLETLLQVIEQAKGS
ncbi:MAG: cytochrome c biogenesis protein CcdA [Erysipelotrichaceae bacterium]|nr:cytochrome c biogenesis protein CcdA [Erysipelotrichaceae bacterium]